MCMTKEEVTIQCKTIKTWMYSVFNMAYQDCLIRTNPFAFKTSSIVKNDTVKRQPLTQEQQDSLISFLRGKTLYSKYYEEIYILQNTGLRSWRILWTHS